MSSSKATEVAVYFCCLEALQNAAKHAGPGAAVTIRLTEDDGHVEFLVEDDGVGFDPGPAERGAGLRKIAGPAAAAGGAGGIEAAEGAGTRVCARLPA